MNRKQTVSILLAGALAIAVVTGAAVYRTANAQEATPTSPATETPAGKSLGRVGLGKGLPGGGEALAEALGITVDELTAAYQAANDAALTEAVTAGLITQAQADALRAGGRAFPFGGRWGGWLSENGIDFQALLAAELGITPDELQAAYEQAYTARLDQAVTDGRLTQEQADLLKGRYALFNNQGYQSAMQAAFETAVNQAVADGVITQAQADLILENAPGFGRGFGRFEGFGRHGFGRHGGRGGWGGGLPANPAEPAVSPGSGA